MKKYYLCYLILGLSFIISSCSWGVPLKKGAATNNGTYEISYLFTHDGCKVYRFRDWGQYIYFTNCDGEAIAVGIVPEL